MINWFRRHLGLAPIAQSSTELVSVLRAAAAIERDPVVQDKYRMSADALDDAIRKTMQHGDVPTKDALTVVLMRAELDLRDQLGAQMELSKEMYQFMQQSDKRQEAALQRAQATFHDGLSAIGEQVTGLQTTVGEHSALLQKHSAAIASFYESREASRQRHDASDASRGRIEGKVDTLAKDFSDFRDEIRALIASARKPEEVERLVGMIERHETILTASRPESDDGGG